MLRSFRLTPTAKQKRSKLVTQLRLYKACPWAQSAGAATSQEELRVDCANVVFRRVARLKARAMRKRKEKRLYTCSATKIQAYRRGFEARRMLRLLQSEGVEVWAASGHTRAARRWFERYSGMRVEECGWLRRDQLHRLVIDLRTTHGLPVLDNVVEREVREMMDGSTIRQSEKHDAVPTSRAS